MQQSVQQFKVIVEYTQPGHEELTRRFPAKVDPEFPGKFQPISSLKAVSQKKRELTFEYIVLKQDATNDEVLALIEKQQGLRPALYEEFLCFLERYPNEKGDFPLAALGSEMVKGSLRGVALLMDDESGGSLVLFYPDLWYVGDHFLVVRE